MKESKQRRKGISIYNSLGEAGKGQGQKKKKKQGERKLDPANGERDNYNQG